MPSPRAPQLHGYQVAIVDQSDEAAKAGKRRQLIVLPTGAGKTVVAAEIIRRAVAAGKRVLFVAHRRELVSQASRKLHAAGIDHGIIAAGFPQRQGAAVQVASIQTLHARAMRSSAMELPDADLVVFDEAHHAASTTWRRLIEAFPVAVILGLTATPCRGDGSGLGSIFGALIVGPQIPELIVDSRLVPTLVYAPTRPDLRGIRVQGGDYQTGQLSSRMNTPQLVGDVVTHYLRLARNRRTIVFAIDVAHSVALRNEFARAGVAAEHLDGKTPAAERDAILARLARGEIDVVVNCQVLTEGFDCPVVDCIILARPTKSLVLYRQMVGRGLRPAPGKDHCLVLDHSGATFLHGRIEEPIEWALSPDRRAVRESRRSGSRYAARALVECPECAAVRWQGDACSVCGWRPVTKPRAVEVIEGDLAEVGPDRKPGNVHFSDDDREDFLRQLHWFARERGYAPGWCAHQYRTRFGDWPPVRVDVPMQPTPETLSWIKSRQIAYAKTRAKAGAS